jgi:hypothetical protein
VDYLESPAFLSRECCDEFKCAVANNLNPHAA